MGKANPPSKHHYLPEFYTRQWTDGSGEMVRYSQVYADRFEARRVTPGAIGFERDLYRIPGVPYEVAQDIESRCLSGVDNSAAEVMATLLSGQIPADTRRRSAWARFLMSFWYRAPEDLFAYKESFRILAENEFDHLSWAENEQEQMLLKNLPQRIDSPRLGEVLINMIWIVMDVKGASRTLLTSDVPVLRSNGLAPPEGNYAIPISPTKIFLASWPGASLDNFLKISANRAVKIANEMTVKRARRFVLARDYSQGGFVQRHFGTERVPSPLESVLRDYQAASMKL